jgi:hypothetical protein
MRQLPNIDDMPNADFCLHMDTDHVGEYLGAPLSDMPELDDSWVVLYRITHDQAHDAADRGERAPYDHAHVF